MGIIQSGILSKVSGKVAGVVGGSWKDKAYLRAYVKPANPNTAAQQTQRTKFADCVDFAKPLVGQVFNAYTDRFQKSMSGFNFFIKRNIDIFDGTPVYQDIVVTEGPLSNIGSISATYNTPNVDITWSKNLGNNGKDDDATYGFVLDTSSGIVYFFTAETDRSVETDTVILVAGLTAADLRVWIWNAQYQGTVLKRISISKRAAVV